MTETIVTSPDYFNVTIDAFDANGDTPFTHSVNDLTFSQAADYAEHAVNYFRFAMLDHSDWVSVHIEVTNPFGMVELIELQK